MSKIIKSSIIIIFLLVAIELYQVIDNKTHHHIIDNIYLNDDNSNKVDYLGYIEIERLKIKREIVLGITDNNLLTHVTLDVNCKNLDNNNIILAGHAIKNIFGNLKNIELNDKIKIRSTNDIYHYIVTDITIVSKYNKGIIDDSDLIIITCYSFNERLIVKAKRI